MSPAAYETLQLSLQIYWQKEILYAKPARSDQMISLVSDIL
jgi:hypothetical protein